MVAVLAMPYPASRAALAAGCDLVMHFAVEVPLRFPDGVRSGSAPGGRPEPPGGSRRPSRARVRAHRWGLPPTIGAPLPTAPP
jgi:hypothetical protein